MKPIKSHTRLIRTVVAVVTMAATVLLTANAARASSDDFGNKRFGRESKYGHEFKNWRGKKHRHDPRPPAGTVGAPVATGLNAPFGISVDDKGRVYVAEAGIGDEANPAPGQVSRFDNGVKTVLATNAPFVTDVDAKGKGFTYTVGPPTNLLVRNNNGVETTVDLGKFEADNNPDQDQTYGPLVDFAALVGQTCWDTVVPELQQILTAYIGLVDSDPFRTIQLSDGTRLVADAAGNDILKVKKNGDIRVLAVLPPNVVRVTKEDLSGPLSENGDTLPQCAIDAVPDEGFDYAFEAVPTGMAEGPDGHLYVAYLPGGDIEGAAKVVRINLRNGKIEDFVSGFSNITDIAFGRNGTLYLTELFKGDVVQVPTKWSHRKLVAGTPSVLATVPLPNGLDIGPKGTLYVSINSLTPAGEVVPITT